MNDTIHGAEPAPEATPDAPAADPRPRRWPWPVAVAAISLLAIPDALSASRILYVRDASFLYWPIHKWLRATIASGEAPLWDPYPGYGQPAIADAARQILFPPVLVARLALPEALGFNLSAALAFPAAALGAYLFFRRRVAPQAAALGALVFALAGPTLSTGNMLNHAWALALAPWVLWAADRLAEARTARRLAALAAAAALQALAGEPVTLAVTGGLAVAWAALGAPAGEPWRGRAVAAAASLGGLAAGALLAAAQLLPLADALGRSRRGATGAGEVLPIHPVSLAEAVAWPLFGNPFNWWEATAPWLAALNGGNDPYYYSLYVGAGALAVAAAGALLAPRREAAFWVAVFAVALVCSLGPHTPVYPALQRLVPPLEVFRYPSKYLAFAAFALAALAALAWDRLAAGALPRAARAAGLGLAAAFGLAALAVMAADAAALAGLLQPVAGYAGVGAPGAALLAEALAGAAPRLLAVSGVAALCLWLGTEDRPVSPYLRWALFALVVADPFTVNSAVNPALDAGLLDRPAWVAATRDHPHDRVVLPGKVAYYFGPGAEDGFGQVHGPLREMTTQQVSAIINTTFASAPSAYGLRDALSIDLTNIWPREYYRLVQRFASSPQERRVRYLERVGVRYFVSRRPPSPDAAPRAGIENFEPALYEGRPPLPRALSVPAARVEPDVDAQIGLLFDESFDPSAEALLAADPPAPAGEPGVAAGPFAEIVEDRPGEVVVRAGAPEAGAFVVLSDSFDPHWEAEVDGAGAPVVRANGLFRAVRIASGEHTVRFVYRPTPFYLGLAVSAATALALAAAALRGRRRAGRAS